MSGLGNVQFQEGSVRGSDPESLYYNALIINKTNSTSVPAANPPISYQDTRVLPLLKDTSKYQVSVDNLMINGAGKTLPIFIPQIQLGPEEGGTNLNPNNTIYSVTFTNRNAQSTRYIQWSPESRTSFDQVPLPYPNYTGPQIDSPYYYCYTYSHWLSLMNNALALAWGDVNIIYNNILDTTLLLPVTQSPNVSYKSSGIASSPPPSEYFIQDVNFVDEQPVIVQFTTSVPYSGDFNPFYLELINNTNKSGPTLLYIVGESGQKCSILISTFEIIDGYIFSITGTTKYTNVSTFTTDSVCTFSTKFAGTFLGTKCPFFTYNSSNNLFSLWQDAYTCVTAYGGSIGTVPNDASSSGNGTLNCSPYQIFGPAETDNTYLSFETSYVGYNTNLESLITNFNSTYYADKVLIQPDYPNLTGSVAVPPSDGQTYSCVEAGTTYLDTANPLYFPEHQINTSWYTNAAPMPNLQGADGTGITNPIELKSIFPPATAPTSTPYYYVVTQDYQSTSSLWSPVSSIVLETTFISVREEYNGPVVQLGKSNFGGNDVNGSFQKALIEVPIEVNDQVGWRGLLRYEPKIETFSSLGYSKEELKNLNVRLLWRNRQTNKLNPLQLYSGGSTSMRLRFKKIA
jgi:hypothetical protein